MNSPHGIFILVLLSFISSLNAQTANNNATEETKSTLQKISDLQSGCHIVFGQNLGHGAEIIVNYPPLVDQVFIYTGKRLAMIGSEYGFSPVEELHQANQKLISFWKSGGLVTVSWRADNPWNGLSANNTEHQDEIGGLVIPGNPAYDTWKNQLSEISDVLEELRDSGVVVLWRPLPEMNGNWFWWGHTPGNTDASRFTNIWKDMYDYMTNERQLNNLIWVYSVSHAFESPVTFYYPGAEYVDIVGMNIVDDNTNITFANDYTQLAALGKPMGITEFSPALPHPFGDYDYTLLLDKLKNLWGDYVFCTAWHDFPAGINSYASNENEYALLNDPCAITMQELYSTDTKLPQNHDLQIFPNPVESSLKIQFNGNDQKIDQLILMNCQGKKMQALKAVQQIDFNLDVSTLPAGVYFLLVVADGYQSAHRFVKD